MQHIQQQAAGSSVQASDSPVESKPFSWQAVSSGKRPGLKDVLESELSATSAKRTSSRSPNTLQLTMRQTVANAKSPALGEQAIGPGSPPVQQCSASDNKSALGGGIGQQAANAKGKAQAGEISQFTNSKPIPQSIRHIAPVEPVWGLSMSEIVAQQQAEKEIIKEAAAKRDLQDIQAEQEFQEWWDKECARVQEAEKRASTAATKASKKGRGRGGRPSRGAKGNKERGGASTSTAAPSTKQ